jgi:glyoxylase-like metal-dependent hydrolase (beta-lactamase superfamily II)
VDPGKPAFKAGPQRRIEKLKGRTDMSTHLGYEIFVAEPIPQNLTQLLPNGDRPMWSPLSTTLIHGHNDAVLVDPPFTREQAQAAGDPVQASNKNLTHIFVTHGHGDHWFTAGMFVDKFGAQIIATAGTIEQMHRNVAMRDAVWDRLGGQSVDELRLPILQIAAEVLQ